MKLLDLILRRPKPEPDRPMTERERAEYWTRVTFPATANRIAELSRHHP